MKSRIFVWITGMALFSPLAMPMRIAAQVERRQAANFPRYIVTDLGPVGGPPGQPLHIADSGLISGAASANDGTEHAVIWYKRLKIDIGKLGLGGRNSVAFGNNLWGQTVGEADTSSPDESGEDFCGFNFLGYSSGTTCLPFLWQLGAGMTPLPTLDDNRGHNGAANAINIFGEVAGVAENIRPDSTCPPYSSATGQYQRYQFKPVVWVNRQVRELPTGMDPDGVAFSVNDNGQVVGASGTCTAFQGNGDLTYLLGRHALLWQDGTPTDLGNLGGTAPGGGNVANSINNEGEVVGSSGTSDGSFHGFLWTRATGIQDLGTIGGDVASVALGINDGGVVVGISFDSNFSARAFVRLNGALTDLNTLVSGGSPLLLSDACSINSNGQIIGIGVTDTGEPHGFLATPVRGR